MARTAHIDFGFFKGIKYENQSTNNKSNWTLNKGKLQFETNNNKNKEQRHTFVMKAKKKKPDTYDNNNNNNNKIKKNLN